MIVFVIYVCDDFQVLCAWTILTLTRCFVLHHGIERSSVEPKEATPGTPSVMKVLLLLSSVTTSLASLVLADGPQYPLGPLLADLPRSHSGKKDVVGAQEDTPASVLRLLRRQKTCAAGYGYCSSKTSLLGIHTRYVLTECIRQWWLLSDR